MLIKVKVIPNSGKESVVKKSEDAFIIRIKEKPEQGLANKRIKELLAGHFNIPVNKIRLVKGTKSKNKIFEINKKS